ncbi:MAG TPA: hypothetical protein VFM02_04620 [Candidatus Paceibacterota bacterium]|nr:hypothetical protein [Candidatus Paceibacterota bacterium]
MINKILVVYYSDSKLEIHLPFRIANEDFGKFRMGKKFLYNYESEITTTGFEIMEEALSIEGVSAVIPNHYSFKVEKGRVFSNEMITSSIVEVLKKYFENPEQIQVIEEKSEEK